MNDDDLELAGAVADELATEEERARVDADAELRASAERVRALSARMRDVTPPSDEARQAAIAAALVAFDAPGAEAGATAPKAPPNIVSLANRRLRWISAATTAAAIVILAIGGVVISRRGNEGADNATTARTAVTSTSTVAAANVASGPAPGAATTAAAPTTQGATLAAAPNAPGATSPANATVAAPAVAPDTAAAETATALEATAEVAAGGTTAVPLLTTTSELATFAASIPPPLPTLAEALGACPAGTLAPDADYLIAGETRSVAIVSLAGGDRVGALALDDCVVIVSAPR